MTIQARAPESTAQPAPCRDYDPNFRLHGCELPAHDPAVPHRDCLGNEWVEHLPDEPWRCTTNWGSGYRTQQCLIPEGHRGLHLDEHGNRWGEPVRVRAALAAARTAAEAELALWGVSRDDLRAVAADLGVTVERGDSKEKIRQRIAKQAAGATPPCKPDSGAVSTALTERLELIGTMDDEDVRTALAFIAASAPGAFDAALDELLDLGDDEDQDADEEPCCGTCGASIGIFYGRGPAWLHYRGEGTAASPVELFDVAHEPVIAWRPAGNSLIGRLVEDVCDDSPCPVVGLVIGQVDEDTLEVLWGDRRFEDNPGPGTYEPFDTLRPARGGVR
jgi:hypothetical protein